MSTHSSCWELIQSDYRRYRAAGAGSFFGTVLLTQGLWASTVYRLNHSVCVHCQVPILRPVLRVLGLIAHKLIEIVAGISLPPELKVGPGLYIGHFGNIIISPEAQLGSNCNLSQGITMGVGGRGEKRGAPRIGNRVYIGAGAILIGRIEIGDDSAIGAGAVVTKSLPPRSVAVGNPARVISSEGSFDFVRYHGMESDRERLESARLRASEVAG